MVGYVLKVERVELRIVVSGHYVFSNFKFLNFK
jgi:hypothetical protein